jgi:hypothetical protein
MREIAYYLTGAFERGEIQELSHMPTSVGHCWEFTPDPNKYFAVMKAIKQIQNRRADIDWEVTSQGGRVNITALVNAKHQPARPSRPRTLGQAITEIGIQRRFIQVIHQREESGNPVWEIEIPVGDYTKIRSAIHRMARRRKVLIELQRGNMTINNTARVLWVIQHKE